MPIKKGNAAQISTDWAGFYVGGHLGNAFDGRTKVTGTDNFTVGGNSGLTIGGQAGFDYQFNSIVVGPAIDIEYSSASKTQQLDATLKINAPFVATVRARTGYALSPQFMMYITSGYASTFQSVSATRAGKTNKQTENLQGYVIGIGAEYKLSSTMSSFIEYRHYKYLHENYPIFDGKRLDFGQSEIRLGVNYRFGETYMPRISTNTKSRWSGAYMGINTGYVFDGRSRVTRGDDVVFGGNSGGMVGGQIGYDQQVSNFVFGLASDINYSFAKNTHYWDTTVTIETPYSATIRGRMGYLITPNALIYATAGYVVGEQHIKTSSPNSSDAQTKKLGGYVVGIGGEYIINDNISSFVEYRHTKYLNENYPIYGATRLDYTQSEMRLGVNYRFGQNKQVSVNLAVPSWTGPYWGMNLGYAYDGRSKVTLGDDVLLGGNSGYLVGGQIGYDLQSDNFVYGVATDFDVSNTEKTYHWDTKITVKLPHNMTARSRFGYVLHPNLLTYVTGGYAETNQMIHTLSPTEDKGQSRNLKGRVLGLGAEYRHTNNISTFAEYRHYKYLKENYPVYDAVRLDYQQSEIRMGLNYRY